MPPWEKYADAGTPTGPWSKYSGADTSNPVADKATGMWENILRAAKNAVLAPIAPFIPGLTEKLARGAAAPITKPLAEGANIIAENPEGALKALPAIGGTAAGVATGGAGFIPAVAATFAGGAVGEGLNQAGRAGLGLPAVDPQHPTIPFTKREIPDIPGIPPSASRMIIEGALQAGPEAIFRGGAKAIKAGGAALEDAGINAARRAQGFQKSQLSNSKSWSEALRKMGKADAAAEEALKRGDMPWSGSPEVMQDNALKLLEEGSNKVKTALSSVKSEIPLQKMGDDLVKFLDPKNADELATAVKIQQEINDAAAKGGLSIDSLNTLRGSFGQTGFRDKTVGTAAADMYRKAWRMVSENLKEALGNADPKLASLYKEGLRQEEMANVSLGAIVNRMSAERGNALTSIPALGTEVLKRGASPFSRAAYSGGKALEKGAKPIAAAASLFLRGGQQDQPKKFSEIIKKAKESKGGLLNLIGPGGKSASAATVSLPARSEDKMLYDLGLKAFLANKTEEAKSHAKKALKLNPKSIEAKRLLERIAVGEKKDRDTYTRR